MPQAKTTDPLVLVGTQNGVTVIPADTPLTRLNYFEGKFLRAEDFRVEQRYLRRLVALSNQAGGPGVAYGLSVSLGSGDTLQIEPGLAIDPAGSVLLVPEQASASIQELIDRSAQRLRFQASSTVKRIDTFAECELATAIPPGVVPKAGDLYLITIAHAEAYCGEEDVYGKLCEEACITSTDRPYLVEGVVVRAVPLVLQTPLATSNAVALDKTHLRSRVASAYFADERLRIASLISKAGLQSPVWCFGAEGASGSDVPLAVVARAGSSTLFLDAWIARRERIDPPAKRYWQWRMAMRPWDVFLAQILQFQCQLHDLFVTTPAPGGGDDPCRDAHRLIGEAADIMAGVTKFYAAVTSQLARFTAAGNVPPETLTLAGGLSQLTDLQNKLFSAKQAAYLGSLTRLLIRGGMVELPSAGYLPVTPGSALTINQQVRQLMGEGVELRFCIVRPDFVPHALEEAQHMERISLLDGLDHPDNKPKVDILVPNGEIVQQQLQSMGMGFEAEVAFIPSILGDGSRTSLTVVPSSLIRVYGAAHADVLDTGGGTFSVAGAAGTTQLTTTVDLAKGIAGIGRAADTTHLETLRGLAPTAAAPLAAGSVSSLLDNPQLFSRLTSLATEALRFNAARQAASLARGQPGTPVATTGTFVPATELQDQWIVAFWASLNCTRNVFTLAAGDVTPIDLRFVIAVPAKQATWIDFQMRGDLRIEQAAPATGTERRLSGQLSALYSLAHLQAGLGQPPKTGQVTFATTVTLRTPVGQPPVVEVLLQWGNGFILQATVTWDGKPLLVNAKLLYRLADQEFSRRINQELSLGEAILRENPDVLRPGNTAHTTALAALEIIAAALNDPGFSDVAARQLFPPPRPAAEELLVKGTLDWVLFHRRRTKQCAEAKEPVVFAPARRYQLYHLLAADRRQVERIRNALLKNETGLLKEFRFRPVDQVEFGAAVATLMTSAEVVRHDWQAVFPGNDIVYGAIASQGAAVADGPVLAQGRLNSLEAALAAVSAVDPQATADVLPAVPDVLTVPAVDGIVLLVTIYQEKYPYMYLGSAQGIGGGLV
jgi:hypothetical protein